MKILLWSLVSGLVLFAWGFVSHAIMPWYDPVYRAFSNETSVSEVLESTAPEKGLYSLPFAEADRGPEQVEAFVNVVPAGKSTSATRQALLGVATSILSAFLGLTIIRWTRPITYWRGVGSFAVLGLTIGFVSHAYYWNWFQFPAGYVTITILDTLVGWTLVGLAVSGFIKKEHL